jgi:RNA polymerase sigma-70 factor (ECF subfamily)
MTAAARESLPELRVRALAGDAAALRALLVALTPIVQHRVARVLRRRGDGASPESRAIDLLQDVLVVLLDREGRVLRSWDAAGGLSLPNFVGLVAEREAHSILRSGRRSAWAEEPTDEVWLAHVVDEHGGDSCRTVAARELLGLVLEGLHTRLSPRGYAIFEAIFLDERTPDEVMRSFGLSSNALATFRSRVRKTAAELLDALGAGPSRAPTPQPQLEDRKVIA